MPTLTALATSSPWCTLSLEPPWWPTSVSQLHDEGCFVGLGFWYQLESCQVTPPRRSQWKGPDLTDVWNFHPFLLKKENIPHLLVRSRPSLSIILLTWFPSIRRLPPNSNPYHRWSQEVHRRWRSWLRSNVRRVWRSWLWFRLRRFSSEKINVNWLTNEWWLSGVRVQLPGLLLQRRLGAWGNLP